MNLKQSSHKPIINKCHIYLCPSAEILAREIDIEVVKHQILN